MMTKIAQRASVVNLRTCAASQNTFWHCPEYEDSWFSNPLELFDILTTKQNWQTKFTPTAVKLQLNVKTVYKIGTMFAASL